MNRQERWEKMHALKEPKQKDGRGQGRWKNTFFDRRKGQFCRSGPGWTGSGTASDQGE
jgi:hypothetical protein